MSSHEKVETKAKTKNEKVLVIALPRVDFKNHEQVIQQLCEVAVVRSQQEEELHFLEWIKNKFLKKVREEYPTEGDSDAVKLQRIVWSGRLRELVKSHFESKRREKEEKESRESVVLFLVFVNNNKRRCK